MCRLLGVVSADPVPLALSLAEELPRFTDLSAEHSHGWGIGWLNSAGVVEVTKEPVPAATSPAFADVTRQTRTRAAMLHIRQASPGMPLTMANTHPFLADGLCFEHNGYAWPTATLDALVAEADGPAPVGDTDSERYLSLVRASLRTHPAPRALLESAAAITSRASLIALNCLLLTGGALLALAWWDAPTIRSGPDGETERDYRLWYRIDAQQVVIASAGIPADELGWLELPDRSVLEVDLKSLLVTTHVLDGPPLIHPQRDTSL